MATAAEIRNKASLKLGKGAIGQTLANPISSDLDQAYVEVYARLRDESLVNWAFADEVPDAIVSPVVDLVAFARADDYSVSSERYQRLILAAGQAEVRIRRSIQGDYFSDSEEAKYY